MINSFIFLILSLEILFVYADRGKGCMRRWREREGERTEAEVERRGKRKKLVRKGEVEEKWREEIVKRVMHDGGWWEILKSPEPTAEGRSSKLSFICLCHVSVQCNKGKLNVLKCLFMFSIFLCSDKTGKALTNFSIIVRYAVLFFIRDLWFGFQS